MVAVPRVGSLAIVLAGLALPIPPASAVDLVVDTVAPERPHDLSLSLDAGGTPHISYNIGLSLKYAVKLAGVWTVETVDSAGVYQTFSAIAVDGSGAPHVCYQPNGTWYAEKTGGSWNLQQIDLNPTSSGSAIALDGSGTPHVVYQGAGGLTYAVRTGSGWVKDPFDSDGWGPSLVLDAEGDPHVGYARSNGPLKYAVRKNGSWTYVTVDSVATSGGSGYFDPPTLKLDSLGDPRMSYMANDPDYNLKYAARAGGVWTTAVVDSAGLMGWYNSLALDAADAPHITYTGAADELMYARLDGVDWVLETLDPASGVGDFNSLVMTPEGLHVAYRDYPGAELSYAHPAPPTGAPVAAPVAGLRLEPPHPNPGLGPGGTTFRFTLPAEDVVTLSVHDVRGRRVASWERRTYPAGTHPVTWEPGNAPSGVYWIRLTTGSGAAASARWVLLR